MRKLALLLALALFLPVAVGARPLPTSLAGHIEVGIPVELTAIPVVPDMKLLPPSPKTYKPDDFERMQAQAEKGFWLKPGLASERGKEVYGYLLKSPEFADSMKLRIHGRKLKHAILEKTKSDAGFTATPKYIDWFKNTVYAPVPLLIDVGFGTGPAMGPIPCGIKLDGKLGELFKKYIKGDHIFSSAIMLIEDIKGAFDVSAAIANDTLDLVFCHENAHAMMFDMYGQRMDRVQKISNIGHDSAMITDGGLAYIEGWAIAFEALYGPENPLLKLKPEEREKYRISEFLFGRQDPVRRQRYIWAILEQKTGLLKTGQQILHTEGVIAGIFYDILTHRTIKTPFDKALTVMHQDKPVDMARFLLGWMRLFPEDTRVLLRIFLENTNYATASNDCRKLYFDYYQAKLKYVKKELPEAKFQMAKKAWEQEKEAVFAKALAKPALAFANIGPEMWVEITSPESKFKGLRLNLNTVDVNLLAGLLGVPGPDAMKFMMTRSAMGAFAGNDPLKPLSDVLGAEKGREIVAKLGLKPLPQFNGTNDKRQGWLRIVNNIPDAVYQRLAAQQKSAQEMELE